MKHTPGPWHVKEYDNTERWVFAKDGFKCIAQAKGGTMGNEDANATLLAAAPTLLETLEKCLEAFHNLNAGGYSKKHRCFNPNMYKEGECPCTAHKAQRAIETATA